MKISDVKKSKHLSRFIPSILLWFGIFVVFSISFGQIISPVHAVEPTEKEISTKNEFYQKYFSPDAVASGSAVPFSFVYAGKTSAELLPKWKLKTSQEKIDEHRILWTLTWTDPETQLEVSCQLTDYLDFPLLEWILSFKNNSEKETPILENIQIIDVAFQRDTFVPETISGWDTDFAEKQRQNIHKEFILHHSVGSPCRIDDYMPLETPMPTGTAQTFSAAGGRPSNTDLPYFNIQAGEKGWIVVLGWPGQWKSTFQRENETGLRVIGGQELTHFKLLPGEKVRTPRAVVLFWNRSNWFDAQNLWRAWMIQYNVPRNPDGNIVDHHIAACSSHYYAEMTQADTDSQKMFIHRYLEEKIPLDYWWMDAGWYPCEGNWTKTGTWEIDKKRFPNGFRPITDDGREHGVKTILWFEPERVQGGTWLTENHPDWILTARSSDKPETNGGLLNLGNEDARSWLTEHVDAFLKKEGIDFYRQDFNMDPLPFWRANDAPDRQGITEIKHIEGYLAYWDELLRRNPGLRIDSCASGGRRNDLETMRRAVPLLRSDYLLEPVGQQIHSYGIALWIPYFGTGCKSFEEYSFRSILPPYLNLCYDLRDKNANYDFVRKNLDIWKESLVPFFGADYYPLTLISTQQNIWVGWQFNDAKQGKGVIQMFRRAESPYQEGCFPLFGLDPNAEYEFSDVDSDRIWTSSGSELLEKGVSIKIESLPKAVIYTYRKK